MIEGVAFDLEGTIIDVEFAHHEGHLRAAKEVGVSLDLEGAVKSVPHFIGGPDEKVAADIFLLSDRSCSVEQILGRTRFHYSQILESTPVIVARNGFREAFKSIKQRGLKVSIGSLTPRVQALVLIQRTGLDELFSSGAIVLADDVEAAKPAPDVYIETARRMGIVTSRQLVFEDSPNGVRAARAAGSKVIAMPVIKREKALTDLVVAGARRIFLDWDEFNIGAVIAAVNSEPEDS